MSRSDEFDSAGAYVAIKELVGELVLFTPTEHLSDVETDFGKKDPVLTDLVVLSQDGQPEYTDVMVFQGSLIGMLKRKIASGRKVLGVVSIGEAKKGQNAPYILTQPDDAQKQMARDYLAGRVVEQASSRDEGDDPFAVKK